MFKYHVDGVTGGRCYSLTRSGYLAPSGAAAAGDAGAPVLPPTMQQNAPNPFKPETQIRHTLGVSGPAHLRIFDASGRLVRTLVEEQQAAGEHSVAWDGTNDGGKTWASGVYFCELSTDQGRESRKALMLK